MEEQRMEMVPAELDRRSEPEVVVERARLSPEAAKAITDAIKIKAEELWTMLLDAYEGGAHLALGYESWGDYFAEEFGGSSSRAYELLDAGRVVRAIGSHSAIAERPNEAQARELAPLAKRNPEKAVEVWSEIVESTEGRPTARAIKEAVNRRTESEESEGGDSNVDVPSDVRLRRAMNRIQGEAEIIYQDGGILAHTKDRNAHNRRIYATWVRDVGEMMIRFAEQYEGGQVE